jgi:hypothetical protein
MSQCLICLETCKFKIANRDCECVFFCHEECFTKWRTQSKKSLICKRTQDVEMIVPVRVQMFRTILHIYSEGLGGVFSGVVSTSSELWQFFIGLLLIWCFFVFLFFTILFSAFLSIPTRLLERYLVRPAFIVFDPTHFTEKPGKLYEQLYRTVYTLD